MPHHSEVHGEDGVSRCHDPQWGLDRHPELLSKIIASDGSQDGNKRKVI